MKNAGKNEVVIIDGREYVRIYSKTRKGKPHPKGGVFVFDIPIEKYNAQ